LEKKAISGIMLTLLVISMLSSAFIIQPAKAELTTIIVPDDYPTIQQAINAANSGDTIYVRPGTYYENIVVGKTLSIMGENRKTTFIDGAFVDTVIHVTANNVVIKGFTLQNCGYVAVGAGIILLSSNNTISGNDFRDNEVGVVVRSDSNSIFGNELTNNDAGIWLDWASSNTISGNNITRNSYGGISLASSSHNIIFGNNITYNNWFGVGTRRSSNNTFYHNNIVDNEAQVISWDSDSLNIWDIGYPTGGNYWSDYEERYPYAEELDDSGIWDTPYVIDENNQDNYPLMQPYSVSPEADWPTFHHDNSRTGYSTSKAPNTDNLLWVSAHVGSIFTSSPAVVGGKVFIGTDATTEPIVALDENTGNILWSFWMGQVWSSPAVGDGKVFISSIERLYALEENTGTLIWSYICDFLSSSPAFTNGKVFIGSGDAEGKVYCFEADTGEVMWKSPSTEGYILGAPAVSNGKVFIGSGRATLNNKVYAFDQQTGETIWTYTIGDQILSSPSVAYGKVFIASLNRGVYALDEATGNFIWKYETSGIIFGSSPAVAYGKVFIGSGDGKIYALDATTGSLIWTHTTGDAITGSSPAVADGKVFIGSEDGKIYALDQKTGSLIWSYTTGDKVFSSPAVANGKVFIGSWDGRVYAFGPTVEDLPPTCIIELQEDGVEIDEIDVGEFFDIYVGDSTDDTGIKQVRFSSDDFQDGNSTGEWTDWYNWDSSLGDWNASTEIKGWAFATGGDKEVWAEVKDDIGQTANCSATIRALEWKFAIITDLHIGRGYPDYGGKGIDIIEDQEVAGQDYYLTERLNNIVRWINDYKTKYNIKFVVVLGDISDSGEYSELKKAKDILDKLDVDVPYIPVIGNHDVWPYTKDEEFEYVRYFEHVFRDQFEKLERDTSFNLHKQPNPDPQDLQNYAFIYEGIKFVILDCVSREPAFSGLGEGVSPVAVLHEKTKEWLNNSLSEGKPTIIFSHHPMIEEKKFVFSLAFDIDTLICIEEIIMEAKYTFGTEVLANFAGHIHGYYSEYELFWPEWVPEEYRKNPHFMHANRDYGEERYTPADIPVVTTEAVMVASNEPVPKGVIRIVKVKGEVEINYSTIDGEFRALNPYFKATVPALKDILIEEPLWRRWDLIRGRLIRVDFKAFAFTTRVSKERNLCYILEYEDGSWDDAWTDEVKPVTFTHYIDVPYPEQYRTYDVNLTVIGWTPEGEKIKEKITKEITLPPHQPRLITITFSPVDMAVTDPDGRTISKQLNEIPGATYIEFDLNEDGDLDDLVLIPDPLDGNYEVLLIGTATGIYSVTTEFITLQETITQTYTGETVEGAVYVYTVSIAEDVMTANPDSVAELEHLKEFIDELPDDSFNIPELANQRKKALFNKIDEVILKVEAGNYTDVINKLFHDIRAKMDGDSTARDWIVDPEMQTSLCVIIDHIISSIETLQPQPD